MTEINQTVASALTNGPSNIHQSTGSTVFDGPDAVNLYRLVMFQKALELEINTGLRMFRGSVLNAVNDMCGTNFRRKKDAHNYLTELIAFVKGE
jgi:hypothetical protein